MRCHCLVVGVFSWFRSDPQEDSRAPGSVDRQVAANAGRQNIGNVNLDDKTQVALFLDNSIDCDHGQIGRGKFDPADRNRMQL